jgi:membrane protease YdiL (CAAX protease family)
VAGILVELALSWAILWSAAHRHLEAIGLMPRWRRIRDALIGFVLTACACALMFGLQPLLGGATVTVNPAYESAHFWSATGWHLRSVVYEELIFRGALLYLLILKFGTLRACLVSAAAFGIYHWFTFGALGNPVHMLVVFLLTGYYGLVFAWSFARTRSLYLPIGLHFGWNLVQAVMFAPAAEPPLLLLSGGQRTGALISLLLLGIPLVLVPLLLLAYLRNTSTSST